VTHDYTRKQLNTPPLSGRKVGHIILQVFGDNWFKFQCKSTQHFSSANVALQPASFLAYVGFI